MRHSRQATSIPCHSCGPCCDLHRAAGNKPPIKYLCASWDSDERPRVVTSIISTHVGKSRAASDRSCALAMSGHVAAPPPRSVMNSRRLIVAPEAGTTDRSNFHAYSERGRCPLWVISGHVQCAKGCPLYFTAPIANAEAPMGRIHYGPKADIRGIWGRRSARILIEW